MDEGAYRILHDCRTYVAWIHVISPVTVSALAKESEIIGVDPMYIQLTCIHSNLIEVFFIPMDYITMVFALWNFAVVGLVSIFWKGPLWLQQGYLTIMSSLMVSSIFYLALLSRPTHDVIVVKGIFFDWIGRMDNMDPIGAIGCVG